MATTRIKVYDPLKLIPSPVAVRERLLETRQLAERLEILLQLAERLHETTTAQLSDDPRPRETDPQK